jgi:hypothetical protein
MPSAARPPSRGSPVRETLLRYGKQILRIELLFGAGWACGCFYGALVAQAFLRGG